MTFSSVVYLPSCLRRPRDIRSVAGRAVADALVRACVRFALLEPVVFRFGIFAVARGTPRLSWLFV